MAKHRHLSLVGKEPPEGMQAYEVKVTCTLLITARFDASSHKEALSIGEQMAQSMRLKNVQDVTYDIDIFPVDIVDGNEVSGPSIYETTL